jgi:hypothetical protein
MTPETVALGVAGMGLIGVIITVLGAAYLKTIKNSVQEIHVSTNSNLSGVKRDLRLTLIGGFIVVMAALAALLKGQMDGAAREKRRERE